MASEQDLIDLSKEALRQAIADGSSDLLVLDASSVSRLTLPEGAVLEFPARLDDALLFLQPDGSVIVLTNVEGRSILVESQSVNVPLSRLLDVAAPEAEWQTLDAVQRIPLHFMISQGAPVAGSAFENALFVEDPLVGLPFNPLLPPTDYGFRRDEDRRFGGNEDGAPPLELDIVLTGLTRAFETDAPADLQLSDTITIVIGPQNNGAFVTEVRITLERLPAGTQTNEGNLISQPDGSLTLEFVGSRDAFENLVLTFPTDFSSQSRSDLAPGPLPGLIEVDTNFDVSDSQIFFAFVTPEGDVAIDDSLPDLVPDETDAPTLLTPSDLLQPAVTDLDGSEGFELLRLTVAGLPAGSTLEQLGITVPAGADASISTDAATGTSTLIIEMAAAQVSDIPVAYDSLTLSLPADFSTANRSDLTTGGTELPLTLTLDVQTDEDQDPDTDTPVDGTATATRIVDIGFAEDIELQAPSFLQVFEDDGVPNSEQGVDVDLAIEIAITDQDGSETEDPSDPRFAATVEILFAGLPDAATVNTGTLDAANGRWDGTVADARDLILSLPGDYNGIILSAITVITPEGQESVPQVIQTIPVSDTEFDDVEIITRETDAPVEVGLVEFFAGLSIAPDETIEAITLSLPNLPQRMRAVDGDGNPVGTFSAGANNTLIYDLALSRADAVDPRSIVLIFPTDYSSENPQTTLEADISVTTDQGTVTDTVPVRLEVEGDVSVSDGIITLVETDAPIQFTPASSVLPVATDQDGSESIALVSVIFNALPPGTLVSVDGGATFPPGPVDPTLNFIGTLAEYQDLVIQLPTDYSTENPATTLFAEVSAVSDEGGFGIARLDVTVSFELDVTLVAPAEVTGVEDGDGIDGGGVTVDLGIAVAATDQDGSEDSTVVEIVFTDLPAGTRVSTGSLDADTGLWTGTMTNANDLTLTFPGDYSGTVTATITALSPEGQVATDQIITITPTGDIDFDITELVTAETDAPVTVIPSEAWGVAVSDRDPNLPAETLDSVTLTLAGLPANVQVAGVPADTITYNAAAGGSFTFTGTEAQYLALQLTFPTDYSTESPASDGLTLDGTLAATSTEDPTGQSAPVSLRITPEGDVLIVTEN